MVADNVTSISTTVEEGGSRGLTVRPPAYKSVDLLRKSLGLPASPSTGFLMAAKAACLAPVAPPLTKCIRASPQQDKHIEISILPVP
jgi:hypothetical protein